MPHFVCISATGVAHAGPRSTSTRTCDLVAGLLRALDPACRVDILSLAEADLRPCTGCGACYGAGRCAHDEPFNRLYARITAADGLFVVAAHYAPIPARLCMLLEKMEQLAFLPRFHDEARHSPLYHRPAGIIGHAGATDAMMRSGYKGMILDTIHNALAWPIEMDIASGGPEWPNGVLFGPVRVGKDDHSIFPRQEYDWDLVRARITPLVQAVYQKSLQVASS